MVLNSKNYVLVILCLFSALVCDSLLEPYVVVSRHTHELVKKTLEEINLFSNFKTSDFEVLKPPFFIKPRFLTIDNLVIIYEVRFMSAFLYM